MKCYSVELAKLKLENGKKVTFLAISLKMSLCLCMHVF